MPYKDPEKQKEYNKNYHKKYRKLHLKERREALRRYYHADIIKSRKLNCERWRKRNKLVKVNLSNRISRNIRKSIQYNKAGRHWEDLVEYTVNDLKKHIEKQFKDGMNWNNRNQWHIDHKIPISAFNYKKPEDIDFQKCWALSNLQPMWAKENLSKAIKLEKHFQPSMIF